MKKYSILKIWKGCAVGIGMLLTSAAAHATAYTWTGASSQLWANSANWSPVGVPGAADSATIGDGKTVALSLDLTVANLTAGANSTIQGLPALTVSGTFTNNGANLDDLGTITVLSGGSLVYNGGANPAARGKRPLVNYGNITVNSGTLNVGSNLTHNAGLINLNGGSLKIADAVGNKGTLNILGGKLGGHGILDGNVSNSAVVSPGHSPGIMTISGNYTQTSSGTLDMEIGGTTAGTGYDQLIVNGSASLAGTINLIKYNNFLPASGTSFKLITYYSVAGGFATIAGRYPGSQRYYNVLQSTTYYLATCYTDTTLPTVAVQTPSVNGSYSSLSSASGTASDANSGLSGVTIVLYRYGNSTIPAGYWAGGTTWTTTYSASNERPATGTTSWNCALPAVAAMKYYVRATATDKVGNKVSSANVPYNKTGLSVSSLPALSRVSLSTIAATAATGSIRLVFSGALDPDSATTTSHYSVMVDGQPVPVEIASYSASSNSVTLLLPIGSLRPGTPLTIGWKHLLDTRGLALDGRLGSLTAR